MLVLTPTFAHAGSRSADMATSSLSNRATDFVSVNTTVDAMMWARDEVDLVVLAGTSSPTVQFWDGAETVANGVINGGTGDWLNLETNWTNASGTANSSWLNDVAVFAAKPGLVTIPEPISFTGMKFMTDGYQIDTTIDGSLQLIGSPTITTDLFVTAKIGAPLTGGGGITKMGSGTLILSGLKCPTTGPTTVNG